MKTYKCAKKVNKDILSTFSVLCTLQRMFGLSCVTRSKYRLIYSPAYFKVAFIVIVMLFIKLFSIYNKIIEAKSINMKFVFNDSYKLMGIYSLLRYVTDIFLVHKCGHIYLKYVSRYKTIDDRLGRTYYYRLEQSIRRTFIFFSVIGSIVFTTDILSWALQDELTDEFAYFCDYFYDFCKLLSDLDFIGNCVQVKYRLIKSEISSLKTITNFKYDEQCSIACRYIKIKHLNNFVHENRKQNMPLKKCYLLLVDQCSAINTMFGFRIILSSFNYLSDVILTILFTIRLVSNTKPENMDTNYFTIITTTTQVVVSTLIVFYAIYVCEENYREVEKILRYIENFQLNKKMDQRDRHSLQELKDLILTRPVRFHYLFRIEYPTLVTVASTIVMCILLLLQNT